MKAVCQKDKKALSDSIREGWQDMRINMALTSANPDQIVTGKPNLSFPLKHEVSNFGSLSKLTEQEQKQAKKAWATHLKKTSLTRLEPSQFEEAFLKGDGQSLGKNLSTKDLRDLRKATYDLQQESQNRYREILEQMPLLAYLKTGDPNNAKDMDQAFSKITNELKDSLKKIKDEDVDMGALLAFKPLVEGLLQESKGGYCLIVERARENAEKKDSLKKTGLLALGVLSAVPCFMGGPVGAVACLGAGLGAGLTGYAVAQGQTKDSLGRFLTGKEYERIADLAQRDKEQFWELMLLPTAGFGITAGAIKGAKELAKRAGGTKRGSAEFSGDSFRKPLAESSLEEPRHTAYLSDTQVKKMEGITEPSKKSTKTGVPSEVERLVQDRHQLLSEILKKRTHRVTKESIYKKWETEYSAQKISALKRAYETVPLGIENRDPGMRNYTPTQLENLKKIFEEEGLSKDDMQQLIADRLIEEAERLPDIRITEQSLSRFMSKPEKQHIDPKSYNYLGREDFKMGLLIANKSPVLQYVIKRSNGGKLYHGSRSKSLASLINNSDDGGGLNAGHWALSTVKITDLDVALTYAKNRGRPNKPDLSKVSTDVKSVLDEDFPIIYSLKPNSAKKIHFKNPDTTLLDIHHVARDGDNPGGTLVDVQLRGGVSVDEIVSVFVPADKVSAVEQMIKEQNLPISVSPIEPIENSFNIE